MKTRKLIFLDLIVLVIMMALVKTCNNNIEFVRVFSGMNTHRSDDIYEDVILVKNTPKDPIERSKMMINYFDSVGLSIDDISEVSGIKEYSIDFHKLTLSTIIYFVKGKETFFYNENKTYIGSVNIWCCRDCTKRCKPDCTEHRIVILRNLETAIDYEYTGPDLLMMTLFSECRSNINEDDEKNDELLRYYMELRNKKKNKNNI